MDSYVKKDFMSHYNAFLLFMLNNSQDELLMSFTEFCRRVFPAGLPHGKKTTLPEKYTESDIRDLRNFLRQKENMNESQYKYVVEPHLNALWKTSNERDSEGKTFNTIRYTEVLPFIILGYYLYVTGEA